MAANKQTGPLPVGSTIGILGGGQLGWMIGREANRLGYRTVVLDGSANCSARHVADELIVGSLSDPELVQQVAEKSDVVTLETEHVDYRYIQPIEETGLLRPGAAVFKMIQDRLRQRRFLEQHQIPQTSFQSLENEDELVQLQWNGEKAILKTRSGGYDGKGQVRVDKAGSLKAAWAELGNTPCVLEQFVDFKMEISVILARGVDGDIRVYPIAENVHRNHILHMTIAPARVSDAVVKKAEEIGAAIAEAMDYVGLMAVELFLTNNDELLVNEIAPRVHNSGHFTYGACETSQFEQHLRAVCGLPLGSSGAICPSVMLNVLGDLWPEAHEAGTGQPDWQHVFASPASRLYLYSKSPARVGRKMGHVLVKHADLDTAIQTSEDIFEKLSTAK